MSGLSARAAGLLDRVRSAVPAQGSSARTPGRIMAPRIIFAGCSICLVLFGLLMIYSSSSIIGLTSEMYGHDPFYFLIRQSVTSFIGVVLALLLARLDYRLWRGSLIKVAWAVTLFSLAIVYTPIAGHDAYGATRWIALGSFTLQPSEFAKFTVVLVGACIAEQRYELNAIDDIQAAKLMGLGVVLPLALILFQPDKGTTGVLVLTLLVMAYLSGVPGRKIGLFLLAGLGVAAILALRDEYSRARIMTVFDPFIDEYGAGYQLVQGFYALGSGGLTGVGIGLSRQKYNYLPMAHNDFIFAVIGEELGFLGALLLLAVFALLLWSGLKIAENAPDLMGRLIAAGCTSLIFIQVLLNVSGVIGIFPLSGKPVPFISYGGSSIISTLMLVGLVMSVSLRSVLPQTSYERRRATLSLMRDDHGRAASAYMEGSTAGAVVPRSARTSTSRRRLGTPTDGAPTGGEPAFSDGERRPTRSDLRLVKGGASRSVKLAGRVTVDQSGRSRLDLGPSAADRLRGTREEKR